MNKVLKTVLNVATYASGVALGVRIGQWLDCNPEKCKKCRVQEMWSHIMYDSGYKAGREGKPYEGQSVAMREFYAQEDAKAAPAGDNPESETT